MGSAAKEILGGSVADRLSKRGQKTCVYRGETREENEETEEDDERYNECYKECYKEYK